MSTFFDYTKSTIQGQPSMPREAHQPSSNHPNQLFSTRSSFNPSNELSSDGFIPIVRSWGQPCTNDLISTTEEQFRNSYHPMSRWLLETQREQPWNTIGSVLAGAFGSGTAKNVAGTGKNEKQDSERASRGSVLSTQRDDAFCEIRRPLSVQEISKKVGL